MLILFVLSLLLHVVQGAQYFSDIDGNFKIFQPGEFTEKWESIETDMGPQEVFTYFYEPDEELKDPNALYLINYMDYPDQIFKDSLESMQTSLFEETLRGTIESLAGNLVYSENIMLQNKPGRLSRIEYNEGDAIVKSKMYIVEHRFYYLQVFTSKNHSLNTKMDRFLDSFQILDSN